MALGEKQSFFGRLREKVDGLFTSQPTVDDDFLDALEDILITSDLGVNTTIKIVEQLRQDVKRNYIYTQDKVMARIEEIVAEMVDKGERLNLTEETPLVIMMIGVNGVGKTTTIAKLAYKLKNQGKSVLLVAADTFRAAAAEQLTIWADRVGVPIIKQAEGADPSSVIFDGLAAANARGTDVVICDTAGRLHNKRNLMNELAKMDKVINREFPNAQRETLLVLDATTGKNAISQAKEFSEVADLSGIILTKLDGSAKGGIVVSIADEFDLPVKFVGLGEKMEDLKEFNPKEFAESIFYADEGGK